MAEAAGAYEQFEAVGDSYWSSQPVVVSPDLSGAGSGPGQFIAHVESPVPDELLSAFSRCMRHLARALVSLQALGIRPDDPMAREILLLDDASELPIWLGVSVAVNAHPDLELSRRIRDGEPIATVPRECFQDAIDMGPRIVPTLWIDLVAMRSPQTVRDLARHALQYTENVCNRAGTTRRRPDAGWH